MYVFMFFGVQFAQMRKQFKDFCNGICTHVYLSINLMKRAVFSWPNAVVFFFQILVKLIQYLFLYLFITIQLQIIF